MPDLEMPITETVERAVHHALSEAISNLPSSQNSSSDDKVIGVPALAKYLGIGSRYLASARRDDSGREWQNTLKSDSPALNFKTRRFLPSLAWKDIAPLVNARSS